MKDGLTTSYYTMALEIALKAHKGQKDRGGKEYIYHPIAVSDMCITSKGKIVALLHDVVEDSDITIDDIKKVIPDDEILRAVLLLTKPKEDFSYEEYLKKIRECPLACEVKLADLKHNSDLSRLKKVTEKDLLRKEKYEKSILYLTGIVSSI